MLAALLQTLVDSIFWMNGIQNGSVCHIFFSSFAFPSCKCFRFSKPRWRMMMLTWNMARRRHEVAWLVQKSMGHAVVRFCPSWADGCMLCWAFSRFYEYTLQWCRRTARSAERSLMCCLRLVWRRRKHQKLYFKKFTMTESTKRFEWFSTLVRGWTEQCKSLSADTDTIERTKPAEWWWERGRRGPACIFPFWHLKGTKEPIEIIAKLRENEVQSFKEGV